MERGRIALEQQMEELIAQSRDAYYTEYLSGLLAQLRQNIITTEYALKELNRTYQMYQQRMRAYDAKQAAAQACAQPAMEAAQPSGQEAIQACAQPAMQAAQPSGQEAAQAFARPAMQAAQPSGQEAAQAFARPAMEAAQSSGQAAAQACAQPAMQAAQPSGQEAAQAFAQPAMQAAPQPRQGSRKGNVEFAIGAGVLSIVGVLFVLVAFVMLGMTYMNGMVKGMCLYVIAVAVTLFSELVIARKMPKFAVGITGLGLCGLYLSTMLNYLYLGNFNGVIAMIISVVIALITIVISRKKDSGTIKIISFVGCYICVFPIIGHSMEGRVDGKVNMDFLIASAIIFIVNLMTVFIPVKKHRNVVHIFHLISNMLFTILFTVVATIHADIIYVLGYLVSSFLTQGLIFYCLEKPAGGAEGKSEGQTAGNVAAYVATVTMILLCFVVESIFLNFGWQLHGTMGALLAVCLFLFALFRKRKAIKWIPYWLFCSVATLVYGFVHMEDDCYWWCMGVIIGEFLLAKLLSRIKELRVSELVITCITALYALYFFREPDLTWAICFLGAFLVSVAALHYWQSVYEEIILFVLEAFVLINFQNELTPAIMTCILFLGVFGFNNVALFRGKYIKVFNYLNLGVMVCLYLAAGFEKNHLSYGIMLVLGIAFMVFGFREKYGMDFKIKDILLVLFLCYMTLIWDIPIPVLKSIILMVIAIGAVTAGFIIREKKLRISGLVLTIAVCAKIALHDFPGAASVEKMILFLVVGLIALAISGIYIALEKTTEE